MDPLDKHKKRWIPLLVEESVERPLSWADPARRTSLASRVVMVLNLRRRQAKRLLKDDLL